MGLRVYNTLTRQLEPFEPMEGKKVKMFACGPTVYDYIHIGNTKSYIAHDVQARYLRYRGYDVVYIQNITDIEDRLIKRANELGTTVKELADEFTKKYFEDIEALNVNSVDKYEKATDYIPQIIEQIQGLANRGYAYEIEDGVYFDVRKFEEYGKLSQRTLDDILRDKRVSRIEPNPNKVSPIDFTLWKKEKPGEPAWDSPWGKGRPGWHIEDTAISITNFGPQYDIHGGGEDLIFPHHEAEIAQAECFTGKKPFVKYWLHNAFLKIEGRKMSKSLGNFVTTREAIEAHGAESIRFFFATTPYYRPMDYAEDKIKESNRKLERIQNTGKNLQILLKSAVGDVGKGEEEFKAVILETRENFIKAMDNNFNTADALAVVFEFVRDVNDLLRTKALRNKEVIQEALNLLNAFSEIFGVEFVPEGEEELPTELMELIKQREEARKAKDWATSDRIRDELKEKGIVVEDTKEGTVWRRVK